MACLLIIDDDPDIIHILEPILAANDYEVSFSTSAQAGLKLLRNHHVDVVITDILMPDFDGIELIRVLKNKFPDVKIIAISGGGSDRKKFQEYLLVAKRLGAHETIPKPIDMNRLLETIHRLITPVS